MSDDRKTEDIKAESDGLWSTVRDAIARLDLNADEVARREDEDWIPEGQVLTSLTVCYTTSYIDEDGEIQHNTTYMIAPGTSGDAAVGMLAIAQAQILHSFLDD